MNTLERTLVSLKQLIDRGGRVLLKYPNGDVRVLPIECYMEIPEAELRDVLVFPAPRKR